MSGPPAAELGDHVPQMYRVALVSTLMIVACGQGVAEAPAAASSAVRVAVIDTAGLKKFTTVLEAVCGQDKRILQVDRTMIHALVKERRLQLVLGQGNWRQAGKMLNAEVLVLIGKDKRQAFARVIATHLGVVLAEHRFDAAHKRPDAQAQHVYNLLSRDLRKARLKPKDVLLLSAAALTAEVYSAGLVGLERRLTLELLHRLANHPRIVLLERRRLDTVAWEQSLDPSAKLATAKAVLIGSISRKNGKILLDGHLRPAGKAPVAIRVDAPAEKPELLAPRIVTAILKAADLATAAPWSPKAEAGFHAHQAKMLVYHGLIPEAAAAGDSAFALGCRDRELLLDRVMAHSLLACPAWSAFWSLDPGPWRGGFGGYRTGPILDVIQKPWRIPAAVRAVDALHDYFRYVDATEKIPFDQDPRIVGARVCLYGSRVLLSAYALGLPDRDMPGQFAYLRRRLRAAAEFVFKLPASPETRAIRKVAGMYIPLWYESLDERMAAYARLLAGPDKPPYGLRWDELTCGEMSMMSAGARNFRGSPSNQFRRVYELGGPHGQIYPWEPDVLARRKKWLGRIVRLARSTTPSDRQLGWMMWKLWMDTQSYLYCHQQKWLRREHPTFNWKTEARQAWGLDAKTGLDKWTRQKILAMAWELRERIVTVEDVPFGLRHVFIAPLLYYAPLHRVHMNERRWLEYLATMDVRFRWLKYLATDAPNIPERLTLGLTHSSYTSKSYTSKLSRDQRAVVRAQSARRAALFATCRKRLAKIKPEFKTRKKSYMDNHNRTVTARRLDLAIAGKNPYAEDASVRRTKTPELSVTKGPAVRARLLCPDLMRKDRRGMPTGSRPAKETHSRTWWETWRRRCLWRTQWRKKEDGKSTMAILAINPRDGSFWAIDVPGKLLQSIRAPWPRPVIAEDAIYLVGPSSCARWQPGRPWETFDIPSLGEARLVNGKFYVLFPRRKERFGLSGSPSPASGLYEYDPATRKVTLLVSSRRLPGKTVLDNCPPYQPEVLFVDAQKRLNLIVRSWDDRTDTIYRRDGPWKWTPVYTRTRTRLMMLEYDRVDGRTFVHGRHIASNHAHHEEWGILGGANALVECIWRHPMLEAAKGLVAGTPRDKCPPGPFVRRNAKRYYLGGHRRHGTLIKPELLVYDEKTGRTSSRPLAMSLPTVLVDRITKPLLVGGWEGSPAIGLHEYIKRHLADRLTARRLRRVEGGLVFEDAYFGGGDYTDLFWFVPWTAIDEASGAEAARDSPWPGPSPPAEARQLAQLRAVIKSLAKDIKAIADQYPELAGFKPISGLVADGLGVTHFVLKPAQTRQPPLPKELPDSGISLVFLILTDQRYSPPTIGIRSSTRLKNLRMTVCRHIALSETPSSGLREKLKAIFEKHQARLIQLDEQAAEPSNPAGLDRSVTLESNGAKHE